MAAEGLILLFLLAALAFPLVLYYLVRAEHDRGEELDRADAERVARRDTPETAVRAGRSGDPDENRSPEETGRDGR